MSARARLARTGLPVGAVSGTRSRELTDGWTLVGTDPGAVSAPDGLAEDLDWRPAVVPGTVAGSLGPDRSRRSCGLRWTRLVVSVFGAGRRLRPGARRTTSAPSRRPGHVGRGLAQRRTGSRVEGHVLCVRGGCRGPRDGARTSWRSVFAAWAPPSQSGGPAHAGRPDWSRISSSGGSGPLSWAGFRGGLRPSRPWDPGGPYGPRPSPRSTSSLWSFAPASSRAEGSSGVRAASFRRSRDWKSPRRPCMSAITPSTFRSTIAPSKARCTLKDPQLWWPRTHGPQALYACRLDLTTSAGTVSVDCGQIGFRKIEVDHDGRSDSVRRQRRARVLPRIVLDHQ